MTLPPASPCRTRAERGIAMVEFVIVLPVVLLIMFGVTELGRAMLSYNTLTKSVQDGARHAAAYGLLGTAGSVYIDAALAAEIRNLVIYGDAQGSTTPLLDGLAPGQIDISVPAPGEIRVAVTYPYTPGFGGLLQALSFGQSQNLNLDLRASVTMRAL